MGKFSDTLKENNLSSELTDAVGAAESIYGALSGASLYYGAAYSIGEKLGFWGGGKSDFDRLAEAIANIVKALREGFAAVLAGQDLQGQQDKIDKIILKKAEALGALSLLKTVPPGGSLTPTQVDTLTTDTDCDFYRTDVELWNLPYYPHMAHSDSWFYGKLEPPHDASVKVFAIVLPKYLQAIALRVTALAAAFPQPFREPGPGDSAGFWKEILDHTEWLAEVHDIIRGAIVALRVPTATEMLPRPSAPRDDTEHQRYWTLSQSDWAKAGRRHGAVELYSTTDSISSYPDPEPQPPDPLAFPVEPNVPQHVPPPNPNAPDYVPPVSHFNDYGNAFDQYAAKFKAQHYPRFVARHAAASLREQKVVYNAVGLDRLWSAMNRLRVMAGEATRAESEPADGSLVRDGVWSLREFGQRVLAAVGSLSGNSGALSLTVRTLGPLVGIPSVSVGSLRQVLLDESGRVP
jgi:hypothetical protein